MDMSDFIHGSAPVLRSAGASAAGGSGAGAMLAGAALDTGVQMFTKNWEMNEQHRYSTQEQNHAFELQQLAQRNAAMNTVEGYKMAGLSPALAAQGSFAPAAAVNAPSKVNASGVNPRIAEQASLALLQSQIELNKSQAEKNNAEAGLVGEQSKTQGITNARMTQEDLTARDLVSTQISVLLDSPVVKNNPALESALGAMLESSNQANFNLGTLRANSDFIKLIADGNRTAIDKVRAEYENVMLDWYLQNNKFELDVNEVKSRIAKNSADVLRASAEMALAYSNIDLNSAKARDLVASAADHLANAGLKYSNDYVSQFKSGDYAALGINAGMNIISAIASGGAYGAGIGVAGKIAGRAASIGVKNGGKAVSSTAYNAGNRLKNLKVGASKSPFDSPKSISSSNKFPQTSSYVSKRNAVRDEWAFYKASHPHASAEQLDKVWYALRNKHGI